MTVSAPNSKDCKAHGGENVASTTNGIPVSLEILATRDRSITCRDGLVGVSTKRYLVEDFIPARIDFSFPNHLYS